MSGLIWTSVRGLRGRGPTAFAERLGFAPPTVGRWLAVGGMIVRWTEPDAWLLSDATAAPCEAAAPFLLLSDLSASLYAVEISGEKVRALLSAGCPLDLDRTEFGPDACAASLFNEAPIWLRRTHGDAFEVICDRALGHLLWEDLNGAAALL